MPIDNSLVQFQLDYIELLIGIKRKDANGYFIIFYIFKTQVLTSIKQICIANYSDLSTVSF
jgi:hypothetical protein